MGEMALYGKEGVRTGAHLLPSKCVKKNWFWRQTPGYFSTVDLTQIFEQTFHQFAHSTGRCVF